MNWEDEVFSLSKRKFRENANIINVFSPKKVKLQDWCMEEIQEIEITYNYQTSFYYL